MSEENSGGGLKNAIIGLVTIVVTAVTGVVAKAFMGGDEDTSAPAPAVAPVINLNLENNNEVNNGGGSPEVIIIEQPAEEAPQPDAHLKARPKW